MDKPHAVYWISPRGFANEGTYVYGEVAKCREAAAPYADDTDAAGVPIAECDTAADARRAAERCAREKQSGYGRAIESSIGVSSADDYLAAAATL